jgi:hypothetical protein
MWFSRFRNRIPDPRYPRPPASQPRRTRLNLEKLEERTLPSGYTAASVAALIADLNDANASGGSNTIVLAANTTFDLTTVNNTTNGANGLPVIAKNDNLTISGQGGDILQRDPAAPAFRLFDVASGGSLTLTDLTVQNGLAFGSGSSAEGGAIYNQGSLAVNGATVQNNTAEGSNGTYGQISNDNAGKSTLNGNDAAGGAIWSNSTLTMGSGTVLQSNQAVGGHGITNGGGGNAWGGGLYIAGGTANVIGVTVNNNSARAGSAGVNTHKNGGAPGGSASGGAFYVGAGSVKLSNDVLQYNSATGGNGAFGSTSFRCFGAGGNGGSASGGGLFVAGGSVTLTSVVLENNSAVGGRGETGCPSGAGGNGLGGGLYVGGGAIVTLCSDTIEFNVASGGAGGFGAPSGQGDGGGIYIVPKTTVYLDSFTVANTLNNTDSSGTNGSTANIDGSYILQHC